MGSAITALVGILFAFVFFLQISGKMRNASHPEIWQIARFFLYFFLVSAALAIIHFEDGKNLHVIINRLPFLTFFPLAMALSYSKRKPIRDAIEMGAAVGGILTLIFVFVELAMGASRAEGADGNAGPFALSMCLAYTLCLFGMVRSGSRKRLLIMLAGVIAAFVCVLASGMRVMWPLLLLLPLIAIWSSRGVAFRQLWKYYLLGTIITFLFGFLFVGDMVFSRFQLVYLNIAQIMGDGQYNNSLGERLVMWDYAWQTFANNIWIGMGKTSALTGLAQFSQAEYGFTIDRSHFHNMVVNAVMRGGIIETIVTIVLLLGPIVVVWKMRHRPDSRYGVALILSILLIFGTAGMMNIAFGHDIQDSLYSYMTAVASFLVYGGAAENNIGNRDQVPFNANTNIKI